MPRPQRLLLDKDVCALTSFWLPLNPQTPNPPPAPPPLPAPSLPLAPCRVILVRYVMIHQITGKSTCSGLVMQGSRSRHTGPGKYLHVLPVVRPAGTARSTQRASVSVYSGPMWTFLLSCCNDLHLTSYIPYADIWKVFGCSVSCSSNLSSCTCGGLSTLKMLLWTSFPKCTSFNNS